MSRYCNLSTYKNYMRSFNKIKDKCKNFKSLQDLERLFKDTNTEKSYIKNLARNISQVQSRISTYSRVCGNAAIFDSIRNEKGLKTTKAFKPKSVKKEAQKIYSNIQKRLLNNRFVWTTAGVSVLSKPAAEIRFEDIPEPPVANLDSIADPIPEPPPPLVESGGDEILNQLNALGEPTFASLGLGGNSPVGIAQSCFEYLHVNLGIEWWAAIALGTLVIRICLFPLVVIAQRNAAKMNNHLPQLQMIQLKMQEARECGNQLEAARYSQEMMMFMKEKQLNPIKNMVVPLAQAPVFISFFMALREMANTPVESLRTGGILWFTDLTVPDQFYLLPLITSATLFATIELGTDTGKMTSQQGQLLRYVLRGLPIVIFPFTLNFPGAILCYWVSSNFISLLQVGILKIPAVRQYFKIEPLQKFDPQKLPMQPKGFRQGLKDAWTNVKLTKELEERGRLDEIAFKRAGKGPVTKTYKYDPTKQTDPRGQAPISAKKR